MPEEEVVRHVVEENLWRDDEFIGHFSKKIPASQTTGRGTLVQVEVEVHWLRYRYRYTVHCTLYRYKNSEMLLYSIVYSNYFRLSFLI